MVYKTLLEDKEAFNNIPTNGFARFSNYSPGYISKIKNNRTVLSEEKYNEIKKLLTYFRNCNIL